MRITRLLAVLILASLTSISFPEFLSAQDAANAFPSGEPKLRPIEIEYRTLGGLQYSIDGRLLTRYGDFEQLVSPLRDYESERLLKRSESSDLNSKIFGVAGFLGLVTGVVGLLTTPSNQQTPFWVTAIGGSVLVDIGGLFQSEAQTTKFNCVQRYNRFARGEEQVLPQGPSDDKSLLNFDPAGHRPAPRKQIPKAQ